MLPLQKKVKLDDDFSKKKDLVSSALLSSSKNDYSRCALLAEEDGKKLFLLLLLPALLSFLVLFLALCLSLSVSLLERAQSFFFKADEGCLFFENCTKTLNKKILLSLLIELHAARVREIYSTSEPAARKKKQDKI